MDVRCTRCATEYEFDDAKVGAAGVTVKCSSCGHVFKVSQSGATTTGNIQVDPAARKRALTGGHASEWIVRKGDGTTARLKELTTLQKWIVEQKVTRSDEISRTGKSWKRLGEIAELASFFQVVDAANIAAAQPTLQSVVSPDAAAQLQAAAVAAPATPSALAPSTAGVAAPEAAAAFDTNATLADLEDDDPVLAWKRRHRVRNAAITLIAMLLGAAAVAFFVFPKKTRAVVEPLLVQAGLTWPKSDAEKKKDKLLATVIDVLRNDDDQAVRQLKNALEAIAPQYQEDGAFLAHSALVHAALALHAEERARLITVLGQTTRDAQTAADAAKSSVKTADGEAARARRIAPSLGLAFVANAWVRGLKGERSEMSADLDVATSVSDKDPQVVSEARALGAIVAARSALQSNDPATKIAALKAVEEAAAAAADDKRFKYASAALRVELLAIQAGQKSPAPDPESKSNVDAEKLTIDVTALGATEDGRRSTLLSRRLSALTSKPSKPDDATVDDEAGAEENADNASGESFSSLMKRANRARVGDKTRTALGLYKEAVKMRGSDAKPHVGLGWSYLDMGKARRAMGAFRQATKLAPDLAVAHFGYAEAALAAGENAKAAAAYETVLRLDPVGPDSAHARRSLKRLNKEAAP